MSTDPTDYQKLLQQFAHEGTVSHVAPLGNGLINRTYKVSTAETDAPDYVLQCINESIFQDIPLLQHNIEVVTDHLRHKLEAEGISDTSRRVLRFVPTHAGPTYCRDASGRPWRLSVYIPGTVTHEAVTPASATATGRAFGRFEQQLSDLREPLGETIPDFHNMTLRLRQLEAAAAADLVGRKSEVDGLLGDILRDAYLLCSADRSHAAGRLPKRICHCDTKVNNVLYDAETDEVLCVIDLDTVMPSYVFSDYGDFLRTAANTVAEDDPDVEKVSFRTDIYEAFTRGYLEEAGFLLDIELENLPFAVALFPYMQCVRFLADYLNGDTYYRTTHARHNLERAQNQWALYRAVSKALGHAGRIEWRE